MKKFLFLMLAAAPAVADTTESPGDFLLTRKNAGMGYTTYFIAPVVNGMVAFDGSSSPVTIALATQAQALAGTDNATWMTPLRVKQAIDGSGTLWGSITGILAAQTDLQTALDGKVSTSATSAGGNGMADSGKVVVFGTSGEIVATSWVQVKSGVTSGYVTYGEENIRFTDPASVFTGELTYVSGLTNNRQWTLPDSSGVIYVSGADLGTPSSATLTNATGLPVSTGISGLGTGIATALTKNTGSAGAPVLFNGAAGTPSSITLTNGTGLPVSTGVSGLGTGVATALATNTGSAGAPVLFNGAGGTPSSITLTNGTGLPVTGISGLGTGVATALGQNVTGSGGIVLATSPTLVTPTLGVASATSVSASGAVSGLTVTATNSVTAGSSSFLEISGKSKIRSGTDGLLQLGNAANSGFTRLLLGPSGTSYGGLAVTGTGGAGEWQLADGSARAPFAMSRLTTGGIQTGIATKTTTYTAAITDHTILCDASGGGFTRHLPAAPSAPGSGVHIKKTDSSGNSVTIDGNGAETIDGAATLVISAQWTSYQIQSNGTSWFIL